MSTKEDSIDRESLLRTVIRNIVDKVSLREFGWDGDDALPIRPDVRAFLLYDVFRFIDHRANFRYALLDRVVLEKDGTVSIRVKARPLGTRYLILECPCRGVLTYHKYYSKDQGVTSGVIREKQDSPGGFYEKLQELFDWLN